MKFIISIFMVMMFSLSHLDAEAYVIADCYPWEYYPSSPNNIRANDCVLEVWGEPIVPDVDQV